jgi:hypothetical protein
MQDGDAIATFGERIGVLQGNLVATDRMVVEVGENNCDSPTSHRATLPSIKRQEGAANSLPTAVSPIFPMSTAGLPIDFFRKSHFAIH